MAVIEVKVPDIGDFKDVPVIEVLVKQGDTVSKDDSLLTLETDKATMDVPAPYSGTVKELRVKVGDKVSQGSPIVILEAAEAEKPAAAPTEIKKPAAAPAAAPVQAPKKAAAQLVKSAPPPAKAPAADAPKAEPAKPQAAVSAVASTPAQPTPSQPTPSQAASQPQVTATAPAPPAAAGLHLVSSHDDAKGVPPHASPGVRRFARELGVTVALVPGSGPKGRILKEDIQEFVKASLSGEGAASAPAPASSGGGFAELGLPPWPRVDFAKFGPIELQARSRIQKISGPALARNWVMIPHVTQFDEADVTDLEAFRARVNEENAKAGGTKLTPLAFLIKACVAALQKYPTVNSSLDGDNLVLKKYWHIGFAADTPQGLVVPVVRDADRKGVVEVARETAELAAKAREGKLAPSDMQGGTFSISSLGGIGGTAFTPIINAPEVAILGASKTAIKPVWNGSEFVPRTMLPLSLSYDHRVVDGALAARFTTFLAQVLADMRRAIL